MLSSNCDAPRVGVRFQFRVIMLSREIQEGLRNATSSRTLNNKRKKHPFFRRQDWCVSLQVRDTGAVGQ